MFTVMLPRQYDTSVDDVAVNVSMWMVSMFMLPVANQTKHILRNSVDSTKDE